MALFFFQKYDFLPTGVAGRRPFALSLSGKSGKRFTHSCGEDTSPDSFKAAKILLLLHICFPGRPPSNHRQAARERFPEEGSPWVFRRAVPGLTNPTDA
jgi:hypothetical protein